jgi:hypothetical protein
LKAKRTFVALALTFLAVEARREVATPERAWKQGASLRKGPGSKKR